MTMNRQYPFVLWLASMLALGVAGRAAETNAVGQAQPDSSVGTLYDMGQGKNKALFTLKRTATRSNETLKAVRDFSNPDGSLAAREVIVYQAGQLDSFFLDEKQTGAQGNAKISSSPKNPARRELHFDWTAGGKKKTASEVLQPNTLVADMIPDFVAAHWKELSAGTAVNFRFVVPSRLETVGFKLVKDSEVTTRGVPALRLKMQASSFIIAQLVDPLFFVVEKASPHRMLEYEGRTTPKVREGNKWKDLDARTVFDAK